MTARRFDSPLTASEVTLLQAMARAARYAGHQEGTHGRMVPVYKVPAWRVPNEDGAALPVQWARLASRRGPIGIHYGMELRQREA